MAKATHAYHKRDLYSDVTARILAELETGAVILVDDFQTKKSESAES
jgi:hypothetical protein